MKTKFLLTLAALFVLAASASAETKLSEKVAAAVSALNDTRESEHKEAEQLALELKKKYIKALTKTKNTAQKAGKLDTLIAAEAEIKRVNSGSEDQNVPKDKEVLRLKTAYTDVLATLQRKIDQKKAEADQRHAAEIDLIVAYLTKQGKIDEAKLVLTHKKPITKVSPPAKKAEEPVAVKPQPIPPVKETSGIIGTTWVNMPNKKKVQITFLEDGLIKSGDGKVGLHKYKIIDQKKVGISWSGRPLQNYEIDNDGEIMTGPEGIQLKRVAQESDIE